MLSNAATSFIHLDEIWNTTSSNIKVFAGIISKSQQALAHPTAPHAATAAMKATAEAKDL
jgi:hypothetical protein